MEYDDFTWEQALKERYDYAQRKFEEGKPQTEEDIVIIALCHPDLFDILVRKKER